MRHDFGFREAAHLVADIFEGFFEAWIAVTHGRSSLRVLDQLDHAGARLRRRGLDQRAHGGRQEADLVGIAEAELVQPHDLALAHHHPTE